MKLVRLSLLSTFSVGLLAFGCASDPNKKIDGAETTLTNEQQKARSDQAELDRKQAEERAESQGKSPDKQAELQRKHESDQASTRSDGKQGVSGATQDLSEAHANMAKERRDFEAKVKERLDKADAKAKELKTKSGKLNAKKTSTFNSNSKLFNQERQDVEAKSKTLGTVSDDMWASVKTDVEKKLEAMESTLDKMGSDL